MDMSGEYRIPAPRQRVWEALNDPAILKAAIPGCESLEKTSDTVLEAAVRSKIGPVSAKFTGVVTLSDLDPPRSYKISGEGKGGAAGFAKGGADVVLDEDGDATILRYTAKAEVGGKLAQIGSRLVQGSAKKMADDFFGRFAEIVGGAPAAGASAAEGETAAPASPPEAAAAPIEPATALPPEPAPPAAPAHEPPAPAARAPDAAADTARPAAPAPAPASTERSFAQNPIVWIVIAIIVILILLYLMG